MAEPIKEWIQQRTEAIHERVSAYDVLVRNGVPMRYGGGRPEQISCPFHGEDRKPSARYHPAAGASHSAVFCFVCNERWDAITLWKKFANFEGKFSALLAAIERDYGLSTPEMPKVNLEDSMLVVDHGHSMADFIQLLDLCENRLRLSKRSFDMQGYLLLGSVLDKLRHHVTAGLIKYEELERLTQKVLDKILERTTRSAHGHQ